MRDDETGSWWQQITGKALFGPLKGQQLDAVLSDELTFALWKQESPGGLVLAPVAKYVKEYDSNWEPEVAKLPVVISFPGTQLQSRDVLVGIQIGGESRAYPVKTVLAESPIQDRLGGSPILLVVGPDKKSIRAFVSRIDGSDVEFFRDATAPTPTSDAKSQPRPSDEWSLIDSTGGKWDFRGCALDGTYQGKCLEPVYSLKDYWFDWRNYHPDTTIYHR
jgi:uncharacterized protein DUF3179